MGKKVVVIAFDGLDKELVDKFDLENVSQEENGGIDNHTNVKGIKTNELFASFITGKSYEEHGIGNMTKYVNEVKGKFIDLISIKPLRNKVRGFHRLYRVLRKVFDAKRIYYGKEDLEIETIFEKIENSQAMFVPSYNPSIFWVSCSWSNPIEYGYPPIKAIDLWKTREHSFRRKSLFSEIGSEIISPRDFLMCHFHRPDIEQHIYLKPYNEDGEKLFKAYKELDELAGEIKDKALEAGYDTVIFMSDHGLPAEGGHNENAFYSCNHELFGEENPHITDFHDKILELTK